MFHLQQYSTNDAVPPTVPTASGGFAVPHALPSSWTKAQIDPPQANSLKLTSSIPHLSHGLTPNSIYPRSHLLLLSANLNPSPTSTAGSSGAPSVQSSAVHQPLNPTTTTGEMEDEPRDFAHLPSTSPHLNTSLILPPCSASSHTSGAPSDSQRERKTMRFAPVFAPITVVPYGAERVMFVESLIWSCISKIERLYGPQDTSPPFAPDIYGASLESLVHQAVLHSLSGDSALLPIMHVIRNPPPGANASTTANNQPSDLIPLPLFLLEMLRRMRTSAFLLLTAMRWVADLGEKGVIDGVREKMACAGCKSHFVGCRHMPEHLAFLEPNPQLHDSSIGSTRFTRMGRVPPGKKERPSKKRPAAEEEKKKDVSAPNANDRQRASAPSSPTDASGKSTKSKNPVIEKIRDGTEDFNAFEQFALAPLEDPKKTVLGALVLAAKWHRDKTVGDKIWGSIVGLSTEEVGRAERALAMGLSWEMGRGWVARAGCGGQQAHCEDNDQDCQKKKKSIRKTKKQMEKERLEQEERIRAKILEAVDIQALFPTSDEVDALRDANVLVAGSVHPSWSEAICAHGNADRDRFGVKVLWDRGLEPRCIYGVGQRPQSYDNVKSNTQDTSLGQKTGMHGVDWEAMEILFGLREAPSAFMSTPQNDSSTFMRLDSLEATPTKENPYPALTTVHIVLQPTFTDTPLPSIGSKVKRADRGEWEDSTELLQPEAKKRPHPKKEPAFSTAFAPAINANYSAPKTVDPFALQQALHAVPHGSANVAFMSTPSDHPSLTSAGSSDTESTPELEKDDGMHSVVSSRNPSVASISESDSMIGLKSNLIVPPQLAVSSSNHAAGLWDAEPVHVMDIESRKGISSAPTWGSIASTFPMIQ